MDSADPDPARDEGAVLAVIQGQYVAWADNDADAFAAFYAADASVVQPGVYKQGRDEIRSTMAAAFAGPLKGSRVIDETLRVRFPAEDVAVVISQAGILLAGEVDVPVSRVTWVVARQDGAWLIAAFQNSPAT